MEKWIMFYNKLTGEELTAITLEGTFAGEIKATRELLAYDNGIAETDIDIKIK